MCSVDGRVLIMCQYLLMVLWCGLSYWSYIDFTMSNVHIVCLQITFKYGCIMHNVHCATFSFYNVKGVCPVIIMQADISVFISMLVYLHNICSGSSSVVLCCFTFTSDVMNDIIIICDCLSVLLFWQLIAMTNAWNVLTDLWYIQIELWILFIKTTVLFVSLPSSSPLWTILLPFLSTSHLSQHQSIWFIASLVIFCSHNRLMCLDICSFLITFNVFFVFWLQIPMHQLPFACLCWLTHQVLISPFIIYMINASVHFACSLLLHNMSYVLISSSHFAHLWCFLIFEFIIEVFSCWNGSVLYMPLHFDNDASLVGSATLVFRSMSDHGAMCPWAAIFSLHYYNWPLTQK